MADTQADQGTQEQVQEQQQETQAAPQESQSIPKQRFDEVYQERKRFQEENERLMAILAAQAEAAQAAAQAPRQQAPEPEEPQFDEQTARVVDAIERRIFKKLEPRGKQTQNAYDMAERADFYASYVATGQIDRKMADRVEQLVARWRQSGDTKASRKDALYMLMGYDTLQNVTTPQNDMASRRAVMGSGGLESPAPAPRQKDYDSLPRSKALEALEKDLGDVKF